MDENLNITDEDVRQVKEANAGLAGKSDDKVRDMMRQEALGRMGFATYKECFAYYMKEHAILLFDQVMNKPESPDRQMYLDALRSLGLKIRLDKKIPTAAAIYEKLMS